MGFESSSSSTEAVTEIERARARDEIERVRALGMERRPFLSPVIYSGFSTSEKCGEHRVNKASCWYQSLGLGDSRIHRKWIKIGAEENRRRIGGVEVSIASLLRE
ncbi:hypothetical protein YC2023_057441 [Brassica napus]